MVASASAYIALICIPLPVTLETITAISKSVENNVDNKVKLGSLTQCQYFKIAQLCVFCLWNNAFKMQWDAASGNLERDYFHFLVQHSWRHSRSTMWSQALDAGQHAVGPAGSRTWFFRSNRGHGRPPLKAFSLSHLDRVFRPLPQEALQADQGDQLLSLQSSGHGMWHTSSVYPEKEHWRSLTQISKPGNHSNDVGEAERATAPADLDCFLLKHQQLISRPVAAFLQLCAKHENVFMYFFVDAFSRWHN